MTALDSKATAEAIRHLWEVDPPAPGPEDRHAHSFLEAVCDHLGVAPDAFNCAHVARLMMRADIDQHHPDEYPKMLTTRDRFGRVVPVIHPEGHPKQGLEVVFATADEEAEYHAAAEKAKEH